MGLPWRREAVVGDVERVVKENPVDLLRLDHGGHHLVHIIFANARLAEVPQRPGRVLAVTGAVAVRGMGAGQVLSFLKDDQQGFT